MPEISWLNEDLPGFQEAVCSVRYGLMTSKKTQTAIVKLEVIVAVIQSIRTNVSSEKQGVISHTTIVFQVTPVTHSQKRHSVSFLQTFQWDTWMH
jgi:hypothetical protein